MGKYACWATVSCGYDMIPPFGGSRLCLNTRLDNSEVLIEAQQTTYITSASDSTWRTTINYHPCQMIFRHQDINWNYGWFGGWSQANPLFSWAAILFVVFSVCLMWPNQLLSSHWFLCYLASHVSVKAVKHLVHLKRSHCLAFLGCLGEFCSKFACKPSFHIFLQLLPFGNRWMWRPWPENPPKRIEVQQTGTRSSFFVLLGHTMVGLASKAMW